MANLEERIRILAKHKQDLLEDNKDLEAQLNDVRKSKRELEKRARKLDKETKDLPKLLTEGHGIRQSLRHEQDCVRALQEQILDYQTRIVELSGTPTPNPGGLVDDERIRKDVQDLFLAVQDFVVRTFSGHELDFESLPKETKTWLIQHIPDAPNLSKTEQSSIHIITAHLSHIITEAAQPRWYFGKSDEDSLCGAANRLATYFEDVPRLPGKKMREWLRFMRELITHEDGADALKEADKSVVDEMMASAGATLPQAMLSVGWMDEVLETLRRIFAQAVGIFRMLQRQQARFYVAMVPAVIGGGRGGEAKRQAFDRATMENLNGGDTAVVIGRVGNAQAVEDRTLEASVFPAVFRRGDVAGENLHLVTVICKAKVVVSE